MCGIVAVTGYKKALPLLINGLEKLEYRGYDSAGIAIINSETNAITCNKAEGKLQNLIFYKSLSLQFQNLQSQFCIFSFFISFNFEFNFILLGLQKFICLRLHFQ